VAKYDLVSRGFTDFVRLADVIDQRSISRDPLSGILDGVSKTFHTSYFPILTSGSLGIYVNNALVPGTANYDTGEVTLTSVPVSQPFANYITTPYTASQISQFTIAGFYEMEGRWTRGWQLLDGTGAWADENSANVYLVDGSGNDPAAGSITFSTSRAQIAFFLACCEYRFLKTQFRQSAVNDYMWRESVRGMAVDKSKTPANIKLALDALLEDLLQMMAQAQIQYYPGGDQYGGFIANPGTADYFSNMEWQSAAIQSDYRSWAGFNFSYRPVSYP